MKKIVSLLLLVCVAVSCYGNVRKTKWKEKPSWSKYFQTSKVQGCILFYDLQKNTYFAYDKKRVKTGFIPASTFKIFNSLVALETGAARDENEVLKWNGIPQKIPNWNQDHDMRTAFKNSTVWFYQEIARRIGQDRMQRYINDVNYGNKNIGGGIDRFWLDGDLRTTAKEQIDFLIKLYRGELPFSPRTINIVKDISISEKTDKYTLRGKTGWAFDVTPQIGWWVGYVERDGKAYFFAMNIDIKKDEDLAARQAITKNILSEMKIIEP